jgi:hypothetical protein
MRGIIEGTKNSGVEITCQIKLERHAIEDIGIEHIRKALKRG